MQGERDACEKHGDVYIASLKGLINQIKNDLGQKEIKFVIGRLSDFDMDNERCPHWTMVRETQVAVAEADPLGAWVDTDDLNDGRNWDGKLIQNDIHYSVEGYNVLGKRFANQSISLIKQSPQPSVSGSR